MAVLKYHQGRTYRRLYGRVRRGPLRWMRDPTLILTLTLYSGPHAAARLEPPLKPQRIGFKTQRYGKGELSEGQPVSGWVGGQRQENCLNIGDANKS